MNRLSYFKVGLFVIAATVIAVIGVILLGVGTVFQKTKLVETYIDESVQGLDIGSAVKFRGVQIGKVEDITLTSVEYSTRRRYVLVRIGLSTKMFDYPLANAGSPGFNAEIEKGLRVRLAAQGFTGVAYIEADYADPQRNPPLEIDWQPKYPYVPSTRSRITQLSESAEKILRSLEDVDVGRLVDGIEKSLSVITKAAESAKLDKLGAEATSLLAELRDTNRELNGLVRSKQVKSTLDDAAAAAQGAREIIQAAETPLRQILTQLPQVSENLGRLLQRLDTTSGDLPETGAQLRQTLRRVNRMLANQQQEIQETVRNLRAITENVKELTEESKRYPSQALFGAPPPPSGAVGQ